MSEDNGFEAVNAELLTLLRHLNNSMKTLEEFEEAKRASLYEGLQNVITSFQHLDELKRHVKGSVPDQVICYCDQGKDPREYAKTLVQDVQRSCEEVRKKQEWMRHLKNSLDVLIDLNFPGESYDE